MTTTVPAAATSAMIRRICLRDPISTPWVGSCSRSSAGLALQPLGEQCLLLIAAAQSCEKSVGLRRSHVKALQERKDCRPFLIMAQTGAAADVTPSRGNRDILDQGRLGNTTLPLPVRRQERDTRLHRAQRREIEETFALQLDLAASSGLRPEQ